MTIYFSKKTRGFYEDDIHVNFPDDAVEVTPEEYAELLAVAYPAEMTVDEMASAARARRDQLLRVADKLVCTAEDDGGDTSALRAWRTALRNVPESSGFPTTITWPVLPDGVNVSAADAAIIASAIAS